MVSKSARAHKAVERPSTQEILVVVWVVVRALRVWAGLQEQGVAGGDLDHK